MELITAFLDNTIVSLIGYIFSLIAAVIAVSQFIGKTSAQKRVRELTVEIENLQNISINNNNRVEQGEKSQYFQENSGSVNIDNRG